MLIQVSPLSITIIWFRRKLLPFLNMQILVYRVRSPHWSSYEYWHLLGHSAVYSYVNRRFGECHLHLQGRNSAKQETSVLQVARSSTLKMDVIRSSETSDHIRTTWRYIPEDGNIHNYLCENLKFYNLGNTHILLINYLKGRKPWRGRLFGNETCFTFLYCIWRNYSPVRQRVSYDWQQ
jgi:hypothetical protein